MAFKFMSKIRHSFNSRRNARKQMRKPSFERKTSVSPENRSNLNDEIKIESSPEPAKDKQTLTSSNESQVQETAKSPNEHENEPVNTNNQALEESRHDLEVSTEKKSEKKKHELDSRNSEVKKTSTRPDSTIIIIYQDENRHSLSSPQIISGKRGEAINVKFKEFEHFDLIHIDGFTSVFVEPYGSMTLTYRRQSGANIWLFSQDIDDLHMLGKPRFVSGKVDEKYSLTPPNFIGYNLLRAEGPVNGNFNEKQQVVTYYYRDASWKEVDFNVKYLKMQVSQPGYDAPHGNNTYITLAKDTVWQVFETVQLTSGERWHCLGGNLWIQEDYDKVRFVDSLPQYQIEDNSTKPFTIDLNFQAIIDFVPNKKLTLYNRPFGEPIDSIEDGSIVTITEREGGREMQWFKVDDRGWTIRQYLDFDIEHKVSQEKERLSE
ncbi:MucBP domain-containing protein [Ligilactobacillus araffinosus]|uniref:MucBP domain-containing protein n=1 Tax=Ligilactobacillus araffinosus DSM 20653 TaxID=1423820 RepID=A0A0R1ZCS8_9LACO|nr:MucBP domain-containing protein [Ligilactobacillus araffinosus]KRM52632.1 hypothetical protein FC64_GL000328 [Ligilactobacillus araffinosus DSM 20653]